MPEWTAKEEPTSDSGIAAALERARHYASLPTSQLEEKYGIDSDELVDAAGQAAIAELSRSILSMVGESEPKDVVKDMLDPSRWAQLISLGFLAGIEHSKTPSNNEKD